MNFDDYQIAASSTSSNTISSVSEDLDGTMFVEPIIYPTLGLTNEAGEVAGKVKKIIRDKDRVITPTDKIQISDEIGDVLWYIADLCSALGLSMTNVAQRNLNKLADRKVRGVIGGEGDYR